MWEEGQGQTANLVECSPEQRQLAALCHFVGLPIFTLVGANIIAPLVIWLLKKGSMPFVDEHGKESLNFQITVLLVYFLGAVTFCHWIGMGIIAIAFILQIVLPILAGVAAWDGKPYRYPLTIRLIS